ncbi:PREDICTED: uncharacterized protein LOC104808128 isoform X2 [Tarenaya hassleriana]|uniref:uncharacterized protein LOC104808128 isoform X2 n=1 Tax=Tarenaya hassleriana TaxID=28532 RepID=UPI00053C71F2|nr:PREDICTED: uncharacterized protein LOC104808128 isoform X2 [Tarenaya hassleriana]
MAADVSSLVQILRGYKDDRTVVNDSAGAKTTVGLMTRDLLGGACAGAGDQSMELDLDLQVPNGWEKRLDLKSGKVYLTRWDSTSSSSSSSSSSSLTHTDWSNQIVATRFQDLNFPPTFSGKSPSKQPLLNLFDDTSLELKLVASSPLSSSLSVSTANSTNSSFESVCTLDKVKSALERAEKKRQSPSNESDKGPASASPVAAGCPGCLSYVLVMKNNPKCPRCNSFVPLPAIKKPKIDLNMSI